MSLNFRNITSGLEIESRPLPGVQAGLIPHHVALIGQAGATFAGKKEFAIEIADAEEARSIFGAGSQLHRMALGVNGVPARISCFVVDASNPPDPAPTDPASRVLSFIPCQYLITLSAIPASNLVVTLKIGNDDLSVSVPRDTVLIDVYKLLSDNINANSDLPVTAQSSADSLTITAKWADETSNQIRVQAVSTGIETFEVIKVAGSGIININNIFKNMGKTWYTLVNCPAQNTSTVQSMIDLAEARLSPDLHMPCLVVQASILDYSNFKSLVEGYDSRCLMILGVEGCQTPEFEIASDEIFKQIDATQEQPNLSARNIALRYTQAPAEEWENSRKLVVVNAGGATVSVDSSSNVYVDNDATTSKLVNGKRNNIWQWAGNVRNDMAKVNMLTQMFESAPFDDYIVISDNTVTSSKKAVPPSLVKAFMQTLMSKWGDLALSKNIKDMQKSVRVSVPIGTPSNFFVEYEDDFAVNGKRILVRYQPFISSKV